MRWYTTFSFILRGILGLGLCSVIGRIEAGDDDGPVVVLPNPPVAPFVGEPLEKSPPPVPVHSSIVADPTASRNQQPTVLGVPTSNTVIPLVNIQTPNASGVSHNMYSRFDVPERGAILNNSRADVQTQLGGWIQSNPWLSRGSARVILNEVNSSNPSLLRGFLEVAGNSAQVIIANPSGITCNGCGFINAYRPTLTTGVPMYNSGGNLELYRVERGTIEVTGNGLNAKDADYTDLIARVVKINAGIWTKKELRVTTGANLVKADNTTLPEPISHSSNGATPTIAIDVAALGGMYAQKITLIGTEDGVGVRNVGTIGAGVGEVIVKTNGRLENTGHIIASAEHNTQIDARDGIQNKGTIYAGGNTQITTYGSIENNGAIAAFG
ncbi:MAG TPA: hypothetical protein DEG23_01550, partial [Coxiellaceae bacterium]|nr:hypothetical protein [Coxiellaceae bacterium]